MWVHQTPCPVPQRSFPLTHPTLLESHLRQTWCNMDSVNSSCWAPQPSPPPPPHPKALGLRPYPWLSGSANKSAQFGSHLSPDPLVNITWPSTTPLDRVEMYRVEAMGIHTDTPSSFRGGVDRLLQGKSVEIVGAGSFRLDFGSEFAGWIELVASGALSDSLWMGVSENGNASVQKTRRSRAHANGVYRLETNWLLYEGVRFGFVFVQHAPPPGQRWYIQSVQGLGQTLPISYSASFEATADPMLTRVWWTGAYCPKPNMGGPPVAGARFARRRIQT